MLLQPLKMVPLGSALLVQLTNTPGAAVGQHNSSLSLWVGNARPADVQQVQCCSSS